VRRSWGDINDLLRALISYKLTDNFNIKRSHDWINRPEVLVEFSLPNFSERTLYRVLEILGSNRGEIISDIQDVLFLKYEFEHTNINMDWTSFVLHGNEAHLQYFSKLLPVRNVFDNNSSKSY